MNHRSKLAAAARPLTLPQSARRLAAAAATLLALAAAASAAAPALHPGDEARFRQFALNALVVPLLDDAEPPRWTDVGLRLLCGAQTHVEVDGRPLVPGAAIPATAFRLRWDLHACRPLGREGAELSGRVELLVFHEDEGLSAIVDARGLHGAGAQAAPFSAAMALGNPGSPGTPPSP